MPLHQDREPPGSGGKIRQRGRERGGRERNTERKRDRERGRERERLSQIKKEKS